MMEFLLDPGDIGDVTLPVLVSAAANIGCGASMARKLLNRAAVRAKHLITQGILNTATENECCGVEVLKKLAKCKGVELDNSLLRCAAGNATSGTMCMAIGLQSSRGHPRAAVTPRQPRKD